MKSNGEWDSPNTDNNTASCINHESNGISFCCRIHKAIDLFKDNQGGNFEVKLNDDMSSSDFEDSNEESN